MMARRACSIAHTQGGTAWMLQRCAQACVDHQGAAVGYRAIPRITHTSNAVMPDAYVSARPLG